MYAVHDIIINMEFLYGRVTLFENHSERGLCYLHTHFDVRDKTSTEGVNVLYFVCDHIMYDTICKLNSKDERRNKFLTIVEEWSDRIFRSKWASACAVHLYKSP